MKHNTKSTPSLRSRLASHLPSTPTVLGATVVVAGIASAALTELPGSLPASVSTGDTIEASHISDIFTSLRTLDDRTDGDTPVDGVDLANKDYVDNEITTATADLASTSYVDTQVANAGGGGSSESQVVSSGISHLDTVSTKDYHTHLLKLGGNNLACSNINKRYSELIPGSIGTGSVSYLNPASILSFHSAAFRSTFNSLSTSKGLWFGTIGCINMYNGVLTKDGNNNSCNEYSNKICSEARYNGEWVVTTEYDCNNSGGNCAQGLETRTVECQIPGTGATQGASCDLFTKPSAKKSCNMLGECYEYLGQITSSHWSFFSNQNNFTSATPKEVCETYYEGYNVTAVSNSYDSVTSSTFAFSAIAPQTTANASCRSIDIDSELTYLYPNHSSCQSSAPLNCWGEEK